MKAGGLAHSTGKFRDIIKKLEKDLNAKKASLDDLTTQLDEKNAALGAEDESYPRAQ